MLFRFPIEFNTYHSYLYSLSQVTTSNTIPSPLFHTRKIRIIAAIAMTKSVKVLGAWPSPFVMRPRLALNLKSVSYEFLEETFGTKSVLLLKSNPVYKKIPVLLHNEKPICESMIIVQYIDEVWTSGSFILPSDPYDRAIARFWATYIDDKFFPSMFGIAKAETDEAKAAAIDGVITGLGLLEEAFKKCSNGKAFFGGDQIGYLDIALGSYLGWLKVAEKMSGITFLDAAKVPGLVGWAEDFCADAAVKEVMPETEKLMEFANTAFERLPGAAA